MKQPRQTNIWDVLNMVKKSDLLPSAGHRMVALSVLEYDGYEDGECFISIKKEAELLKVGRAKARQTLSLLQDRGLISLLPTTKGNDVTRIAIDWPKWHKLASKWDRRKHKWIEGAQIGPSLVPKGAQIGPSVAQIEFIGDVEGAQVGHKSKETLGSPSSLKSDRNLTPRTFVRDVSVDNGLGEKGNTNPLPLEELIRQYEECAR